MEDYWVTIFAYTEVCKVPYKDNRGFFYKAEILNKKSNKTIGSISISATTGAVTGDLEISGKSYKINSFENRIISLSEVEETSFICDSASVPQKGRKAPQKGRKDVK